ncbi:MORN repeat-containing protein 5 isoform X1 [Histomonas meleagridis]|uniref:MORN repeat-containing protein 5 isoform X1 n=1 Tax=Histomonas meleagridis TaxID=135588 RepID=UPI003559D02A|nr:MORN repeat-containing protein 5 isoform X1 [Histomonas meleagridis]KAH0799852.1 MORN repeat-containing protein 5 isoform X1 [Histomonas meleagridis]
MNGKGEFTFSNGTRYVGEFLDGQFHGQGVLYYPGRGCYKAQWDHGKVIDGQMFFEDGLEYSDKDWKYCSSEDRRFYPEITNGLHPAGESYITPTQQEAT